MTNMTIRRSASHHDLTVDGRRFDLTAKGAVDTATRIIVAHLFPDYKEPHAKRRRQHRRHQQRA